MDERYSTTPLAGSGPSPSSHPREVSTMSSSKSEPHERPKFTPSVMALQRRGLLESAATQRTGDDDENDDDDDDKGEAKKRHGISLAYRGDPSVKGNRSADIDVNENTALFLQNGKQPLWLFFPLCSRLLESPTPPPVRESYAPACPRTLCPHLLKSLLPPPIQGPFAPAQPL